MLEVGVEDVTHLRCVEDRGVAWDGVTAPHLGYVAWLLLDGRRTTQRVLLMSNFVFAQRGGFVGHY